MLVDASPLIYLAKLDALDVVAQAGHVPLVTPEVERETSRPGLAYRFADAVTIANALRDQVLVRIALSQDEALDATRLATSARGIHPGESEVLAIAAARGLPVLLYERRALRLARSLGLDAWSPIQLLVAGTPDPAQLRDRIVRFAGLVELRYSEVDALLRALEGNRR
ncbi:MAG: hypothetical protein H0V12_05290 [Chloroflexi bacterium]|nr:hypothetical protein [Chloroflexota bacterium]